MNDFNDQFYQFLDQYSEPVKNIILNWKPNSLAPFKKRFPLLEKKIQPQLKIILQQNKQYLTFEYSKEDFLSKEYHEDKLFQKWYQIILYNKKLTIGVLHMKNLWGEFMDDNIAFREFLKLSYISSDLARNNIPNEIHLNIYKFLIGKRKIEFTAKSSTKSYILSDFELIQNTIKIGTDATLQLMSQVDYLWDSKSDAFTLKFLYKCRTEKIGLLGIDTEMYEQVMALTQHNIKYYEDDQEFEEINTKYCYPQLSRKFIHINIQGEMKNEHRGVIELIIFHQNKQNFTFGSNQDNDLVLPFKGVSNFHGTIQYNDDLKEWFIIDGQNGNYSRFGIWREIVNDTTVRIHNNTKILSSDQMLTFKIV